LKRLKKKKKQYGPIFLLDPLEKNLLMWLPKLVSGNFHIRNANFTGKSNIKKLKKLLIQSVFAYGMPKLKSLHYDMSNLAWFNWLSTLKVFKIFSLLDCAMPNK